MSVTGILDQNNLVPEIWSSMIYAELRKSLKVAPIFERRYQGEIMDVGSKVKVHQILAPTAQTLSSDKDVFDASPMETVGFEVTADRRAVASFEITDLLLLQSLDFQLEAQRALVYSLQKKIDDDLIAALAANVSSSPDHDIAPASASSLAPVDLTSVRSLLRAQSVVTNECTFVMDVNYYSDLLRQSQFTSADFINPNATTASGEIRSQLFGFSIAESESLSTDVGYACHPSAIQVVMQQDVRIKMSDLHNQRKFGMLLSADIVWGYKVFDNKRYVKISG